MGSVVRRLSPPPAAEEVDPMAPPMSVVEFGCGISGFLCKRPDLGQTAESKPH
uniref:Uncharacterized protein n=1 Tax=Rhizophora mucronata TaxID=61149 RepID=A0A2P2QEP8_RHIMU